ncbi:hypothetical protein KUW04_15430 [Halomonas denitrificans]|nr:hypothetical protein [Halomonas denitrificans]
MKMTRYRVALPIFALSGLFGCTEEKVIVEEKVIIEEKVVIEEVEVEVETIKDPDPAVFYTAPTFLSASVADFNNQKAQINGDGSFSFKVGENAITYPVTFSALIPEGYKKAVNVQLQTYQGNVASAITSFISRLPVHQQAEALARLSSQTGIESERLLSDFEGSEDTETAKVARTLYYIDAFNMESAFDEHMDNAAEEDRFFDVVKRFIEEEKVRSEVSSLTNNYYYARHLDLIVDNITSQPEGDDINKFFDAMSKYREKEYSGVFGSVGTYLFSQSIDGDSVGSYEQTFDEVSKYIDTFVDPGASQGGDPVEYTAEELIRLFHLSDRNQQILNGEEGDAHLALFNQLLNYNSEGRSEDFYAPDRLFNVVVNLRNLFVEGMIYNKSTLKGDAETLFGVKLSNTAIDAIKYKLDAGSVMAIDWQIKDYAQFLIAHDLDEALSTFALQVDLPDGGQLIEFNPVLDTGAKAGTVVAHVSANALDGWVLGENHWTLTLLGEDSSRFAAEWDEAEQHYKVFLAENLFQASTPELDLSFDAIWTKYDSEESISDSYAFTVGQDKAFFGLESVAFRSANPSIDNDLGNQLYLAFNKPIAPETVPNVDIVLSDSTINISNVALFDGDDRVLVMDIDSADVSLQVIERDKGELYAYASATSTGPDEEGLIRSDSFDESLYNPDAVLTVQVSGDLQGVNQDGSQAKVNSTLVVPASKLRYRGVNYELTRSPFTGRIFMAQNLGATDKCDDQSTSRETTLPTCRGHYFQYGRVYDGHEIFNHPTLPDSEVSTRTGAVSFSAQGWDPESSAFIYVTSGSQWVDVTDAYLNTNSPLRDTVNGTYCPVGFRVPSYLEYHTEFNYIAGSLVAMDVIRNFSESFFYMGFAGSRNIDGTLGNEGYYTLMTYGDNNSTGNNFRTGTFGIKNNLTTFAPNTWAHFNGERVKRGLSTRCIQEYK